MFGKRNTVTLKKVTKTWCQQIMTLLLLFLIYGCFGAIRNTDSGRMVCDSFLLIATFYLTKSENRTKKISNTAVILLVSVKVLILSKMLIFCKNKTAEIHKIKGILALKDIFSETKYLCVPTYQIPRPSKAQPD